MTTQKIDTPRGPLFVLSTSMSQSYGPFWRSFQAGKWEPETLWMLRLIVRPGRHFIDVGGWIGPTALYAAKLGAHVTAYEPDPVAFETLKINAALSSLDMDLRPTAVGPEEGWIELHSTSFGNSESTVASDIQRKGRIVHLNNILKVKVEKMDVPESSDVIVNVDIEGAEFSLFRDEIYTKGTFLISLHPTNLVAKSDADTRTLRRASLTQILDRFKELPAYRLSELGLFEINMDEYRRYVYRYPDQLDQLVFSDDPELTRVARPLHGVTALRFTNLQRNPARWLARWVCHVLGFRLPVVAHSN